MHPALARIVAPRRARGKPATSGCWSHTAWRGISDHADEEASEAFRDFISRYDGEGGRLAAEVIAKLPANPDAAETYPAIRRLLEE